jgi:hypothetical protein
MGQAVGAAGLLADVPFHPELLWAFGALFGLLVIGWLAISWVGRWRKQQPVSRLNLEEELSHFRTLQERGELSAEEFARIKSLLEQNAQHAQAWPTSADSTKPTDPLRGAPPPA